MIILKSDREMAYMRDAGKIVAKALDEVQASIHVGITTLELDAIAEDFIVHAGGVPSFKGYNGFPNTLCISLNEEVVHGIPKKRRIAQGDLVSFDLGVAINGYHADAARTVPAGNVSPKLAALLKTTEESLYAGIAQAKPGNRLYDISAAIQLYVEEHSFSVVRDYGGHGIGRNLHEDPHIPNFKQAGRGPLLETGMALAIEPMVNLGTYKVKKKNDNWTVITEDRKPSAHFEHTVLVGSDGPEIITAI